MSYFNIRKGLNISYTFFKLFASSSFFFCKLILPLIFVARFSDIISYFISIARTFSLDALRNKFQVVSIEMNRKDVMAIAYWMGFMFLEKSFRVNFENVFFFRINFPR